MTIPESISALSRKHGVKWTRCMWLCAFLGMCLLGDKEYGWIALIACTCLALVGCMPLIQGKHNTAHNILGASSCLLSQLWVALAGDWWWLMVWWLIYLILFPFTQNKWCFWVEIWCITSVIILTIMDIWK